MTGREEGDDNETKYRPTSEVGANGRAAKGG